MEKGLWIMGRSNIFKYKIITLLLVSLIGTLFFIYVDSIFLTDKTSFFEGLYYSFFLYPIVLGAMLPGIPVSLLADYLIKRFKKENLLYSALAHILLCFFVFLLPYILINKELNIFAFFYFTIIPLIYSLIYTFLIIKMMKVERLRNQES